MSIITISRGSHSGGQLLAERVAEQLGYPCVSREEVLEEAAKLYSFPVDKLTTEMDRGPSFLERLTGERSRRVIYVRAALLERARKGPLVYHGQVGHLHLSGVMHVLRVRLIADLNYRAGIVAEERNLTLDEAVAFIKKADKERKNWVRFLFGVEWDDPSMYDVVVNVGRASMDTACSVVVGMSQRPEFRPTAQLTKALNDLALSSRVSAALLADERTATPNLEVSADEGVVTLRGALGVKGSEDVYFEVARKVEGVTAVRTDFVFMPPERYMTGT